MSEKSCGIYKITNKVNGKVYIGQSRDIKRRWYEHRKVKGDYDRHSYPLYSAIEKYGIDNFEFEIIEQCEIDELNNREIYWIDKFNALVEKMGGNGYNLTKGGQLCDTYVGTSDQGKRVYQYKLTGEFVAEYRNQQVAARAVGLKSNTAIVRAVKDCTISRGFQWRDFKTDKISPYIKKSYRKKVYQYDLDGNFIRMFDDIQLAANYVGSSRSLIELCCEGNCGTGKGYMWRYTYKQKIDPAKKMIQPSKWKPVEQYTTDGILIKIYPCANIASQETNIPLSSIRHVLRGESKSTNGYIFRYKMVGKEDKVAKNN